MSHAGYRRWVTCKDLVRFELAVKETCLYVSADANLKSKTLRLVTKYRKQIEGYITRHPDFKSSLAPLPATREAPAIVQAMLLACEKAGVGPMASVAGAIAEFAGRELLNFTRNLIIENGGDIFLKATEPKVVGIYAGDSPLSGRLGLEIAPEETPLGICTSSGTVGHSLSLGKADAVIITSKSATLADAAATATGNLVKAEGDIPRGIEFARGIEGITGIIIVKGDKIGTWGSVRLCHTSPETAPGHE